MRKREKGRVPDKDGPVRWRGIDLADIAEKKVGVSVHADTIGRILHELGFFLHLGSATAPRAERRCDPDF